jgi:bacillithiol system protein YtxJ
MRSLTSAKEFDAFAEQPVALVYKHSRRCSISVVAYQEMEELSAAHPHVPIGIIDVHDDRAVARYVSERTRIAHHSPQVILLVSGEPAWSVTHFDVRADELAERLEAATR